MVITANALLAQCNLAASIEEQQRRYIFVLKRKQPGAVELVSEVPRARKGIRPDLPPRMK